MAYCGTFLCVLIIFSRRMLDDLEQNVDRTDTKLNKAMKKLQKFIQDTEGMYVCSAFSFLLLICNDRDEVWMVYRDFDCYIVRFVAHGGSDMRYDPCRTLVYMLLLSFLSRYTICYLSISSWMLSH